MSNTCLNCIMWEGYICARNVRKVLNNIHKAEPALRTPSRRVQHALLGFLRVTGGSVDLKCNVLSPEDNCVL